MRLALVLSLAFNVALLYVLLYFYERSDSHAVENRILRTHCDTLLNLTIAQERINSHLCDELDAQRLLYAKKVLGGTVINEEASNA